MVTDRKLRTTFGRVSKLYDSARPSYPTKLIDDIIKISGISKNGKILDVGCGPGTATKLFAQRGFTIIGIDIGKDLIAVAKKNSSEFPDVSYQTVSFEDVEFQPETFDLIYSAQAWHWIEPEIAYKKANELLKDEGYLALFWKHEDFEKTEFIQEVTDLFVKHVWKKKRKPMAIKNTENALNENSLFFPYQKKEYYMDIEFTRKKYSQMVHTFSWIINLSGKEKEDFEFDFKELLAKQDETFTIPYKYTLLIAKKKPIN